MNVQRYLSRIKFKGPLTPDLKTLKVLHRQHLLNIPFEGLDIHFNRRFDLKPANIYNKVITRRRGGFCYEINSLFNDLLKTIGYKTRIISGKVITDAGVAGPAYDHMAIVVDLDKEYIADVGFGDLFIEPLAMEKGVQFDGRKYFRIDEEEDELCILMSEDGNKFDRKYTFTPDETPLARFEGPCLEKQTSSDSHFVKNTICTQLTESGRISIYNEKFIETIGDQKIQRLIHNDYDLKSILRERFSLEL